MFKTFFSELTPSAPVEVFALTSAYKNDMFENKVNLGVGAYRTNEGKPFVLPVVKKVEQELVKEDLNHEYLPIPGSHDYRNGAIQLLFGYDQELVSRCGGVQALGGTGALRVGLDFIKSRLKINTILVSKPTWGNHIGICKSLGYKEIREYTYWREECRSLDLEAMLKDIKLAPSGSCILLHACAHNPTGMDPSPDQWKLIGQAVKEKNLFVFFDCAYQGFASGSVDEDVTSVRIFAGMGFEMFIAQSFSKNFGLYNERVGQLTYLVNKKEIMNLVATHFDTIVRQTWSNPPAHGGHIVARILNDPELLKEWKEIVAGMAKRIKDMRKLLYENLVSMATPGTWQHIIKQRGMFSFTGLKANQVDYMIKKHHVYLMKDGRINMCAITTNNANYVAMAIRDAILNVE